MIGFHPPLILLLGVAEKDNTVNTVCFFLFVFLILLFVLFEDDHVLVVSVLHTFLLKRIIRHFKEGNSIR